MERIEDIWNNDTLFTPFRNLNELSGKCQRCNYLSRCKGGCRAMAYAINRDISSPDPKCNLNENDNVIFE